MSDRPITLRFRHKTEEEQALPPIRCGDSADIISGALSGNRGTLLVQEYCDNKPCRVIHVSPGNRYHFQRAESFRWSAVVVCIAFLDWFHIAFNVINLIIISTSNVAHQQGGKVKYMCWLCIGIYVVRVVIQPLIVCVHACRASTSRVETPAQKEQRKQREKQDKINGLKQAVEMELQRGGEQDVRYINARETLKMSIAAPLVDDDDGTPEPEPELILDADVSRDVKSQLIALFQEYSPEQVASVDSMLKDWDGNEEELLANMRSKFIEVSATAESPSPADERSAADMVDTVTNQQPGKSDATSLWMLDKNWNVSMTFK